MFSTNTQDKWYNHNKPVPPSERAARDGAAAAEFADAQRECLRPRGARARHLPHANAGLPARSHAPCSPSSRIYTTPPACAPSTSVRLTERTGVHNSFLYIMLLTVKLLYAGIQGIQISYEKL